MGAAAKQVAPLDALCEGLSTGRTIEEIDARLKEFLAGMGLDHGFFHAGVLANPASTDAGIYASPPICLASLPDGWAETYAMEELGKSDLVLSRSLREVSPISWAETGRSPANDLARDFGMRAGFAIPIHCANGVFGVFGAILAHDDRDAEDYLNAHRHTLFLAGHYVFDAINRVTTEMMPRTDLTPREIEVLRWAAGGKSAWEIGEILSISERTAENHLKHVREKLGVSTKIQAVLRALPLL